MPQQQAQSANADFPIPVGEFDPHKWVGDHPGKAATIVCWAHDDTVVPGSTYRYRVIYKIKNPLFQTVGLAKKPQLTTILDIASKPSEWSKNVAVSSTINFYVVRSPNSHGTVPIQIFRWHNGVPQTKTFEVSPGDAVGAKESNVDYTTGWTMVDAGVDPRTDESFVLLMDPAGNLHVRNVRSDSESPKLKELKDQVAGAAAAAANPSDSLAGTR
jgi:hypothetical protein